MIVSTIVAETAFLVAMRQVGAGTASILSLLEPVVVAGLASEKFLVLPHEEVREYVAAKAADHDRWIGAMRRFQTSLLQQSEAQEGTR